MPSGALSRTQLCPLRSLGQKNAPLQPGINTETGCWEKSHTAKTTKLDQLSIFEARAQGQTADSKVKVHNRNALSYNQVGDYLQNARHFISQSEPKSCCGQGIGFKSVFVKRLECTTHPHMLAHYSHSHCSECACVYCLI